MTGLKKWYMKYTLRIFNYPWTSKNLTRLVRAHLSTVRNGFNSSPETFNKITSLSPSSQLNKQWLSDSCVQSKILSNLHVKKLTSVSSIHHTHLKSFKFNWNSPKRYYKKISQNETSNNKPLPKLLYIQNPLVWLSNKLDFRFLRLSWDPNFTETEFMRGTRQAVSTVTQLLSRNLFDSLKPLLTRNALLNLRRDVEILWADEVRRNIALFPEDVQLIIPRKLHFRHSSDPLSLNAHVSPKFLEIPLRRPTSVTSSNKNAVEKRFCDIDMLFIGLKRLEEHRNPPLIYVDIIARFHRNYSEGMVPDWTISAFKVRRFYVIPQKN